MAIELMNSVDLRLVKKGLDYYQKRKKWVLLVSALGFSGYGAYKVYHLPSVVKKRERWFKLFDAIISIAEAAGNSALAIGVLSNDIKEFIQSDSDQIPNSLRQISKITRSDDFSDSLIRITRALTVGICQGYQFEAKNGDSMTGDLSFSDRAFDKIFSKAGSGFASAVVGSFAKNMVMAFYSEGPNSNNSKSIDNLVDVVCGEKCKELIGDCIQLFVSTAVAVYLDKTMHINTYDELFSGLTNPKHEKEVKEMLASICNGTVETLIKTSHQVLTSTNSTGKSDSSYLAIDLGESDGEGSLLSKLQERKSFDENQDSGWVSKVSSTLAEPNNKRFVLDMAGRVTFETVKSFLEFLLERLSEGLRKSLNVVHEEVVDRGVEVYRYMTMRSSTVVTICLSLCLHILNGPWILVPA